MRVGQDIAVRFPGLYLVHHNIPGKKVDWHDWAQHLLFIPLQGEIKVVLRAGSLVGGPGKMLYVPPNKSLSFQSSEVFGGRLVCLWDPHVWRRDDSLQCVTALRPL